MNDITAPAALSRTLPSGLANSLGDSAGSLAARLSSQLESLFGLDSTTRLYTVDIEGLEQAGSLNLEAFAGEETLSSLYAWDILLLSREAGIPLGQFIGRQLRLTTRLSDGSDFARTGYIAQAERLAADGALARYRVRIVPWLWLATQRSDCRVWQEKSVLDIIESIFAAYAPRAHWQLAEGVDTFMRDAPVRSYCVQYRETDFDFVSRILAEEGLGFCFVERSDDEGKSLELSSETAHSLLIFSTNESLPEDVVSAHALGGAGVRFHRAGSQESQDAITAFGGVRQLAAAVTTALSWDYKGKAAISASQPTRHEFGSKHAPQLETYDVPGAYAFASAAAADRYTRLAQEAREARYKRFAGTSSVRSFRAGHRFILSGSPIFMNAEGASSSPPLEGRGGGRGGEAQSGTVLSNSERLHFLVLGVQVVGINNLPKTLASAAGALGDVATALPAAPASLIAGAKARGYANQFDAQRVAVPWRPALEDETGLRINPRPTAPGVQTAIVVGPEGETTPGAAGEIHTDALHRVRVKFHWQRGAAAQSSPLPRGEGPGVREANSADGGPAPHTTWLRVASRYAGAGLGAQFVPRIGQEVLVGFLEGDIDRPIVLGSLYNGQGDGSVAPTPGGEGRHSREGGNPATSDSANSPFNQAADHKPSAQGNLAGGNSPAWHGEAAAAGAHRNAAALSGFKSAEYNQPHAGYSQLVFDDTDGQLRVQLATTQAATQLNLGHLVHQADNYRGSHRGDGFELRTDGYGALRAARGALFTTWGIQHAPDKAQSEPAGDATAAIALFKQASELTRNTSQIATTHKTVAVASAQGSAGGNQSALDKEKAPLPAQHRATSGVLGNTFDAALSDAGDKSTTANKEKIPHSTDALLTLAAKGGLGMVAGQSLQWAAGETLTWASGQDSNYALASHLRIHTGQALGVLSSAKGEGHLKAIAASGPVLAQAQADTMTLAAKEQLKMVSVSGKLDMASPKKIHLAVAGGSAITIEGGNITVQCPGVLTVHASNKSFGGGGNVSATLPVMPTSSLPDSKLKFAIKLQDVPGSKGRALSNRPWKIVLVKAAPSGETASRAPVNPKNWREVLAEGQSTGDGECKLSEAQQRKVWEVVQQNPSQVWLVSGARAIPVGFSSISSSEGDKAQRQVLDALNYAPNADDHSDSQKQFARLWAEEDFKSALSGTPKSRTKA
ncbi:type VI secretion system Vgr family protein [Viridibacterium curvum]|uniref:Type VI secretion system Vgr family protein n=1 Tax=Viridibacterium curvum TaxID=1101404 RepID=A0ABP9QJD1_9RHOO